MLDKDKTETKCFGFFILTNEKRIKIYFYVVRVKSKEA